jgi:hypothetical protein
MRANLIVRLKDLLISDRAAAVNPQPQGKFIKGINFGGDAVTIEGHTWESYSSALANGLAVPGAESLTTSIEPKPYAKPDIRRMLNTVIYKPQVLEINQILPNGTYEVYLWIIENYTSNWHSLEVSLAGQTVATEIGKLTLGSWARYGPYPTTVTNERLRLAISTNDSKIDAHVMGLSIFKPNA